MSIDKDILLAELKDKLPKEAYETIDSISEALNGYSLVNLKTVWSANYSFIQYNVSSEMVTRITNLVREYEADFYLDLQKHSIEVRFLGATNPICDDMRGQLMLLDSNLLATGERTILNYIQNGKLSYLHPSKTKEIIVNIKTKRIDIVTYNSTYSFEYIGELSEQELHVMLVAE